MVVLGVGRFLLSEVPLYINCIAEQSMYVGGCFAILQSGTARPFEPQSDVSIEDFVVFAIIAQRLASRTRLGWP